MKKEQEIAQHVLDTGTYSFGMLDDIKIDSMSFFIDNLKEKFGIFENEIKEVVDLLEQLKIITDVEYVDARSINYERTGYAHSAEVSIPRLKDFIKQGPKYIAENSMESKLKIKHVRLDKENYLLEINNGDKILGFRSKKIGADLEKETKQFKLLYHLWDFRWEMKNGRVITKGEFTSLVNLARGSGIESNEATYKHIQRLNTKFKQEGLTIEIRGENEKYRLIIYK